jgi:hypothetical protein
MNRSRFVLPLLVVSLWTLSGCGGGPPRDLIDAEIQQAVFTANTAVFTPDASSAEVVDISIGSWKSEPMGEAGTRYEADWTARLRLKQPIGYVVAEVDGKNIVKIVADAGFELPFMGRCGGGQRGETWGVHAHATSPGSSFTDAGAWNPLYDKVPELRSLTMGYPVIRDGAQGTPKFRRANLQSLAQLQPCVVEGTPEFQAFQTEAAERAARAKAAAEERARQQREAREAQQKQAAAEAAERQRLAEEERARKQAEAAEAARLAREAAEQKAKADLHARLLKVFGPLRSEHGAAITADAPLQLSTVILDAQIDEAALRVTGRGIDLREMPFKAFTYEGSVDERSTFSYQTSLGGEPVAFTLRGEQLQSRSGLRLTALAAADRKSLDDTIAKGDALGTAAPVNVAIEAVPAESAAARLAQLQLVGLQGTVIFQGRVNARVLPLFAADLASRRTYAFKPGEVASIRLAEPLSGSGLLLRGTAAPSTEFVVTINGVHQVTVPSIPKDAAVILSLPAAIEIAELRITSNGSVSLRTIGLIR